MSYNLPEKKQIISDFPPNLPPSVSDYSPELYVNSTSLRFLATSGVTLKATANMGTTTSCNFSSRRRPPRYLTNRLGEADSDAVFNNGGKNEKILKEAIPPQRLSGERNSAAMQFIVAELAACRASAFERGGWWERGGCCWGGGGRESLEI